MTWQMASVCVILAAPVLIGCYDLAAFIHSGNDATISRVAIQTAWEVPAFLYSICFLFGMLCGHLFVSSSHNPPLPGWVAFMLLVMLPTGIAFGALVQGARIPDTPGGDLARSFPLIAVLVWLNLGAVSGAAFLPQSH